MEKLKVLFHGSTKVIYRPSMELAKKSNDYGPGFYMTEDIELAKEWACQKDENGIVNHYLLDLTSLNVLNLLDGKYNILNWISILLKYRVFDINNEIAKSSKEYLINRYSISLNKYDVVIGYRADDRYFKFAQDFINNSISLENLEKAFKLGDLGVQVVLISEKAFDKLRLINNESVDAKSYYHKFINRDKLARESYKNIKDDPIHGTYVMDLIRKGEKR